VLIERSDAHKAGYAIRIAALLINHHGKRLTAPALRAQFEGARACCEKYPQTGGGREELQVLRFAGKAADDTADGRGEEAARDLLDHDSVKTIQKHYLRRGKIVTSTK
jgi:hypothetical protein